MDKDIAEKLGWAEDLLKDFRFGHGHQVSYDFLAHELLYNPDPEVRQKCRELMDWAVEHGIA